MTVARRGVLGPPETRSELKGRIAKELLTFEMQERGYGGEPAYADTEDLANRIHPAVYNFSFRSDIRCLHMRAVELAYRILMLKDRFWDPAKIALIAAERLVIHEGCDDTRTEIVREDSPQRQKVIEAFKRNAQAGWEHVLIEFLADGYPCPCNNAWLARQMTQRQ